MIIGAGLAGLSLGQALRQAGINFRIFERDQAASFRAQGYRIRIDQRGGDALKHLLPARLFQHFEETCAGVIPGGHRFDALTHEELGGGSMPPQIGNAWNADRAVLRNLLLTGLESYVDFDKRFNTYDLVEDGIVAYFADGSSASGSILIGADGVRSRVRRQMLPNRIILDTEGRAIFGKTPINSTTFATIPEAIKDGIYMAIPPSDNRIKLFCDLMTFKRDQDPTVLASLPKDYIYWVLVFHRSITDTSHPTTDILSLSRSESAALAESLTKQWHPSIYSIITQQDPAASSPLQFLMSNPPVEPWTSDPRITLMGDAAHPMPPVGGTGANMAFQDAADLFNAICQGFSREQCKRYEETMRERSNVALMQSAAGATRFFGMKAVEELTAVS